MAQITFHPQTNLPPKVYDKEDHFKFFLWYLEVTHRQLTKSEMENLQKRFTYDLDYYMTFPKLSSNIEIQ